MSIIIVSFLCGVMIGYANLLLVDYFGSWTIGGIIAPILLSFFALLVLIYVLK